jgi:hypothetical protein
MCSIELGRCSSYCQNFNHQHNKTSDKKEPHINAGLVLPITTTTKIACRGISLEALYDLPLSNC